MKTVQVNPSRLCNGVQYATVQGRSEAKSGRLRVSLKNIVLQGWRFCVHSNYEASCASRIRVVLSRCSVALLMWNYKTGGSPFKDSYLRVGVSFCIFVVCSPSEAEGGHA